MKKKEIIEELNRNYKATLDELAGEVSRLTKENKRLDSENKKWRDSDQAWKNGKYVSGYYRMEQLCEKKDEEIKTLKSRNNGLESHLRYVLGNDMDKLSSIVTINDLKNENEKLKAQVESFQNFLNINSLFNSDTHEFLKLKKENEELKTQIDKYYDKNFHLAALNDLLEKENDRLVKENRLNGKGIVSQEDRIRKLETENKELKEIVFREKFTTITKLSSRFTEGLNKGLRIGYGIDKIDENDKWYHYINSFQKTWLKPNKKKWWRIL